MSDHIPAPAFNYLRGESRARRHARLETKPTYVEKTTWRDGRPRAVVNTGGGYEHFRSTEAGEQVYASHHRLLALAWNVHNAETGAPLLDADNREGVIDTSALAGVDVHHAAPEADDPDATFGWDNREACLSWVDHGRHSALSDAQKRAYAEDAKRVRDGDVTPDRDVCAGDGCEAEPAAAVGGTRYCIACATEQGRESDEQIQVL